MAHIFCHVLSVLVVFGPSWRQRARGVSLIKAARLWRLFPVLYGGSELTSIYFTKSTSLPDCQQLFKTKEHIFFVLCEERPQARCAIAIGISYNTTTNNNT